MKASFGFQKKPFFMHEEYQFPEFCFEAVVFVSFSVKLIEVFAAPPENMMRRFAFALPYSPGLLVSSLPAMVSVPPFWT